MTRLERGVLVNVTQERVIRMLPPLIIDAEQAADNARADALGLVYESDGRQGNSASAALASTQKMVPQSFGRDWKNRYLPSSVRLGKAFLT